ncbi:hypothetical protein PanWU01x14_148680 [Parasponia andersonii]|uniref:Uncharacterized protein n=1 Tax=Parasponia andersonii TaxID=3476 RepID=A0A2P5CJ51_PARAD|nr:hypothetical protein PanWU01x14_148680 [Parasponia andersonii]
MCSLLRLHSRESELGRSPENWFPVKYKWVRNLQFPISVGSSPVRLLSWRLRTIMEVAEQNEEASKVPVKLSFSRTILLTLVNPSSQLTPTQLSLQGSELKFHPQLVLSLIVLFSGESLSMNSTRARFTSSSTEFDPSMMRIIEMRTAQIEFLSIF